MVGLYVLFEPTREKTGGLWWICFLRQRKICLFFICHPGARGVLNHLNQPKPTILSQPLISLHIVWPAKIRDRLMHSP